MPAISTRTRLVCRIPTRILPVCVLAAGTLALAGCTPSNPYTPPPQPGSTTIMPHASGSGSASAGGGTYADSADVVSALKSTGPGCTPVGGAQSTTSQAPGLQSATDCTLADSGGTITASVFDNHGDAQTYANLLTSSSGLLLGGTGIRVVLGQNWVVLVPDNADYASEVSAALGAPLVAPAPTKS